MPTPLPVQPHHAPTHRWHRPAVLTAWLACADALLFVVASLMATLLRVDLDVSEVGVSGPLAFALLSAAVHAVLGYACGLYSNCARPASFEGVAALGSSVFLASALLTVLDLLLGRPVPASVPLAQGFLALSLLAGLRVAQRLGAERALRPSAQCPHRLLVVGAGEAAEQVLTSLLRSPESSYLPVGLLDDDPRKARLRLRGVPVVGRRADLARAVEALGVDTVLVAIATADADLLRDVVQQAEQLDVAVKVVPPVAELLGAPLGLHDIRPVTDEDLLGRSPVDLRLAERSGYLRGRRVLVTGAGGSIGSELCRQLSEQSVAQLVMLDRDESALHAVQLSIEGEALLDCDELVVADIRDRARMEEVFATFRPEVVFHAAALKHLPLLERHPTEAWKSNVHGTRNVLQLCVAFGVRHVVNISTDKAADPCSVLGYSKRLGERLTASAAQATGLPFVSVRFGNVLGSRGSVLTVFRAQIAAGLPVTVTSPDVHRYFMTVREAVRLVLEAGAVGAPGEVLVLDMGEPVRIADVAKRLIRASGRRLEIRYSGLREGEKLSEVRLGRAERDHRPVHPLICHVPVPPLSPDDLPSGIGDGPHERATSEMARLCLAPGVRSSGWGASPAAAVHAGGERNRVVDLESRSGPATGLAALVGVQRTED